MEILSKQYQTSGPELVYLSNQLTYFPIMRNATNYLLRILL